MWRDNCYIGCKLLLVWVAIVWLLLPVASIDAQNELGIVPHASDRKKETAQRTYAPGDVVLEKSYIYILVGKSGLGHEHAVVGRLTAGTIHLSNAAKVDKIVFDMTTFDADSAEARKYIGLAGTVEDSTRSQVNANMLGENVLDVKQFPTATFDLTSVKKIVDKEQPDNRQYEIAGNFTLHGIVKPITVNVIATERDHLVHLKGKFSILQSNFGITPYSKGFGLVKVADQLDITADIWIAN